MFKRDVITIGAWFVLYILLAIPVVNVITFIVLLFSSETNKSLKNLLWATILPAIIFIMFGVPFLFGRLF